MMTRTTTAELASKGEDDKREKELLTINETLYRSSWKRRFPLTYNVRNKNSAQIYFYPFLACCPVNAGRTELWESSSSSLSLREVDVERP